MQNNINADYLSGTGMPYDRETANRIDEILKEDERRMEEIHREMDPLTGHNSTGERFQLDISDDNFPRLYLPVEMKELPLIRLLEEYGAFHALPANWPELCYSEEERSGFRQEGLLDSDNDPIGLALTEFTWLRLRHDFPFWAASCVSIKRKGGGDDVAFHLNRPQRRLVEHLEEQRRRGEPIRTILLKARQWGGSTCVQMYMAWLQLVHAEGLNSLIIAHQGSGSDEIKDMFDRMLGSYPAALLYYDKPKLKERGKITENVGKSGMIMRVCPRNCKIKIGTAERPDSCRGGDYNLVHLSEVGIWRLTDGKSPEDIVRSACGGILLAPMTMIVYESTANGTGNFFHREYLAATRGESQFRPLFISWYEIDQYSMPMAGEEERRDFARRLWEGRESQASSERSEPGTYLWKLWQKGATLEALKWYVEERKKYNCHARMAAEYPSDDLEAFAHSGSIVFAREDVEALRKTCGSPIAIGEIVSPYGEESVKALSYRDNPAGGLEIWEKPDRLGPRLTDRYLVTVDVGGRSSKADWSVIAVLDRGSMADGGVPRIVAQWRGHCDWDQLAWRAARIAAYYDEALLVIESNTLESKEPTRMVDGAELPFILHQIRDAYPNLYARRSGIENLRHGQELKIGFHTNAATKPMVIATLIRVVREGLYEERCDGAVDEFLTYERRANGSYGAILGAHDDILMTRAIGLHIALHEMDLPRHRRPRLPKTERRDRRGRPTEAFF